MSIMYEKESPKEILDILYRKKIDKIAIKGKYKNWKTLKTLSFLKEDYFSSFKK